MAIVAGNLIHPQNRTKLLSMFTRALILVNGRYLGIAGESMGSEAFTLGYDKNISEVIYGEGAAGTKPSARVVTGTSMPLSFQLTGDALTAQTLQKLQGTIVDNQDGEKDHFILTTRNYQPLKRFPVKIIAVDNVGIPSEDPSDCLNLYEVEIDFSELFSWNGTDQLTWTVEGMAYAKTNIDQTKYPVGSIIGYVGGAEENRVPPIDWAPRINPYVVAAKIKNAKTIRLEWDTSIEGIKKDANGEYVPLEQNYNAWAPPILYVSEDQKIKKELVNLDGNPPAVFNAKLTNEGENGAGILEYNYKPDSFSSDSLGLKISILGFLVWSEATNEKSGAQKLPLENELVDPAFKTSRPILKKITLRGGAGDVKFEFVFEFDKPVLINTTPNSGLDPFNPTIFEDGIASLGIAALNAGDKSYKIEDDNADNDRLKKVVYQLKNLADDYYQAPARERKVFTFSFTKNQVMSDKFSFNLGVTKIGGDIFTNSLA